MTTRNDDEEKVRLRVGVENGLKGGGERWRGNREEEKVRRRPLLSQHSGKGEESNSLGNMTVKTVSKWLGEHFGHGKGMSGLSKVSDRKLEQRPKLSAGYTGNLALRVPFQGSFI